MKINGQHPKLPIQDKQVQQGKDKEAVSRSAQHAAQLAKEVQKSGGQNFAVNRAKAKIEATPDVNLDRVKELKDKLKKGEYKVDAQALAANLIKNSVIEDR